MKVTYKYRLKKAFTMGYIALICIGFLLTIGRWFSIFNEGFVVINAEIHSHISNFSLSMIAYLSIGYLWLLQGVKFRFIVILGTFMIFANLICETLVRFMNTPDIIDAIYGICGIAVGFAFLFLTNKYGLISNNME